MAKRKSFRNYIIKVLNGMALGLFSSLLIGLIMKQIGSLAGIDLLVNFGTIAQSLMGPAIGVGVAYGIGAPPLGILVGLVTGAIGAGTVKMAEGALIIGIGEPVGAFLAALVGGEFSKKIAGKTNIDIVLVPFAGILVGGLVGKFLSPYIAGAMSAIGDFINLATHLHPISMGIILSVTMGIILTLPISSAAVSISLGLSGLAAGASTVGCACNMIGFAIISYKENKISGLISQGLGTSMLQMGNIIKNPWIWLPSIVSSAILGPVSTYIFKMESNSIGAGMGTSGLVGQFAQLDTMGHSLRTYSLIGLMHFILPGIISYLVYKLLVKLGKVKSSDLKLSID